MPEYKVKQGHRAFLSGALREEGYIHSVGKPFPKGKVPDWAEPVSKKKTVKNQTAKAKAAEDEAAKPNFLTGTPVSEDANKETI